MGLLDGLRMPEKITSCKVRTILTELSPEDAEIFINAVNDLEFKPTPLAKELSMRGVEITKEPIQRHRDGACSCSKI